MRYATLFLASFGLLVAVGCETPPSATGGKPTPGDEGAGTFDLSEPSSVDVAQGDMAEATIKIDRGDKFKDAVTLEFGSAEMIEFTPKTAEIPAGKSEATVKIVAKPEAAVREVTVDVTATPKNGGDSAKRKLTINVTKAEAKD